MDHQALDHACRAKGGPLRIGAQPPRTLPCDDLEPERAAWLHARYPRESMAPQARELSDALEDFGGSFAIMRSSGEDLGKILARGQLWGPTNRVIKGADSQCHANSALLFEANQGSLLLATGYALSEDGLWRQHSWCLLPAPRSTQVVETTESRLLYFGFALDLAESIAFCESNSPSGFKPDGGLAARFEALLQSAPGKAKPAKRRAP